MKLQENETNGDSLWENSYYEDVLKPCAVKKEKKYKPHKRFETKVGDYVRLSGIGHMAKVRKKWTAEVFIVKRRFLRQ